MKGRLINQRIKITKWCKVAMRLLKSKGQVPTIPLSLFFDTIDEM